ncbi:hypothetical protein [Terriglobus sp. RCC_193]|uniref:hypothetical protein n=1 Tax=Terriglobus sp. RCC_193 TaxID=3239218 RepID=UPI0035259DAA
MALSRSGAYTQQMDSLTEAAKLLAPEARAAMVPLLEDAHRQIMKDLAQVTPDSYSESRLRLVKQGIEQTLTQLRNVAQNTVNSLQTVTYRAAANSVDSVVFAGTGKQLIQPVLDTRALSIVQGFSADLIGGVTSDATAKINAAIQRSYLGKTTLSDLFNVVGQAQGNGQFSGLFGTLGAKAADTAMNEVMRVDSMAKQARISDLSTNIDGIGKQWVHLPIARVPRVSHILADLQVRKADESFEVGGEALMYPRDPAGSAANTIFCHCTMRPHVAVDLLQPTDRERDLLKSLGLSVTTTRS